MAKGTLKGEADAGSCWTDSWGSRDRTLCSVPVITGIGEKSDRRWLFFAREVLLQEKNTRGQGEKLGKIVPLCRKRCGSRCRNDDCRRGNEPSGCRRHRPPNNRSPGVVRSKPGDTTGWVKGCARSRGVVVGREPDNSAPAVTCTADGVAIGQKPNCSVPTKVCKVACASDTLWMVGPKPGSKPEVDARPRTPTASVPAASASAQKRRGRKQM